MQQFMNTEIAVMHLVYGAIDGNRTAAVRLHAKRYPNRRVAHHQIFENLTVTCRKMGHSETAIMIQGRQERHAQLP